jgi:hypothetical protein
MTKRSKCQTTLEIIGNLNVSIFALLLAAYFVGAEFFESAINDGLAIAIWFSCGFGIAIAVGVWWQNRRTVGGAFNHTTKQPGD